MAHACDGAQRHLPGHLSARASRAIRPALSYFKAFLEAQSRQWSASDPDGNIILSVAENRLTSDVVKERLSRSAADFPEEALTYQAGGVGAGSGEGMGDRRGLEMKDMRGLLRLRKALAALLEGTFMQGISVDPDHLTVSAGAGAIIENLFHCIAGQGDAVLIPSPYYPAFDNDLMVKCGVRPVPFPLDEDRPVGPQLDAAAEAAAEAADADDGPGPGPDAQGGIAQGQLAADGGRRRRRVAALLITTPNNPLGIMYRRETIVAMLRWCLAREVHLVSDEIYGNSVFGEGASFTSTEAYDNLGYFCAVPNPVQWALIAALEDEQWLAGFLATNKARLGQAYGKLEAALVSAGIPHVRADSAMVLLGGPAWLPGPGWEGEAALWEEMCRECRVLLTPGQQCHAAEPGFFRVCWAWVPPDALPAAVRRLAERFGARGGGGDSGSGKQVAAEAKDGEDETPAS
ncbi:hypothetical protein GPECTOR_4g604 [Gonium pectorale]|uniref:Aminotransferase class I/classII large domain-containing protein n=1 Tax=Gonium pectorale TaxID=33097 RepID=A0A150GXI7_GONPE|nr:hypothetical protein GPECTOR_4g604 [Gonium pectorale]|eukprot:KXZ54539.1 hypothetical protein GPECTOR_4g604 [Gonium pectorale]